MTAAPPRAETTELWARLAAFDLDGDARFSFAQRLARDNGWTLAFARRVVLEYRKFVFLAATCGHPVTPSDEVDQAWHLHLVYTRSYWDELCGQVLGFPLHHGPTRGGAAEGHKFQDWYARTLRAYLAAFGTAPPADIWPVAAVRFGEAPHFRRVNVQRHLVLPRPRWGPAPGRRGWLALAAALLLMGCTARMPLNPLNWYGPEFLGLFWGLCLTLLPLAFWLRQRAAGPASRYEGPPLTTYEAARLAGQGRRIADSALAALAYDGKLELLPGHKVKRTSAPPPADPYERAVWNMVIHAGWSDLGVVREQAMRTVIGALQVLDKELIAKGLLLDQAARARINRIPVLACLGLGLFGLAKVLVGINREQPVGLLLISLLGLGLLAWWARQEGSAWVSGRGIRLLEEMKSWLQQQQQQTPLSREVVAMSVALFGPAVLHTLGLASLAVLLIPPSESGSGGDGGGSGGEGGSGCGSSGCGGCGGGGD